MTVATGAERLDAVFAGLAARGEGTLVAYLTACDPDPQTSLRLLAGSAAAGAARLEIGLPAPNPYCDGPIIGRSHARALAACGRKGRTPDLQRLAGFLRQAAEVLATPLLLMGYAAELAAQGGVTAFLDRLPPGSVGALVLPDLEPAEVTALTPDLAKRGVRLVRFVDPDIQMAALPAAIQGAEGLLYAQTYRGSSGHGDQLAVPALAALRAAVRSLRPDLPVVAGFGITTPKQVRTLLQVGYEGTVIGTALVAQVEAGDHEGLYGLVRQLKAATREG